MIKKIQLLFKVLVEKKKITNTPDIESNPFTKLTDVILDFLPDGLQVEVHVGGLELEVVGDRRHVVFE